MKVEESDGAQVQAPVYHLCNPVDRSVTVGRSSTAATDESKRTFSVD